MAVVKFVSDKDCQLFIDMELAGKVTSDSMLKLTLETGGYLIQVKDEDGNLIKEYDLEIKPSDNQLLQKIDSANNLDDIIEKLKNDSTLVFHCDRVSFCHNGLYGFVNKKFNVVIPPIYFSVNEFVDDKAFVVRDFPEGRKATIIDSDGNMFFNRWFDYIGEGDSNILMGTGDRIIVYSKIKFDKIADYYNAGYNFKQPFVPVYIMDNQDEMYGFINLNGDIILPFIFDKVWNADNNLQAKFWYYGFIGTIDFKNSLIFDVYGLKFEFSDPLFLDDKNYLQGYIANYELGISVYPGRKGGKWILNICNYSGTVCGVGDIDVFGELTGSKEIECDRILYIGYNCYAYRLKGKCIVHYLFNEKDYTFNENYIVPVIGDDEGIYYSPADYRFIKREKGKYGIVNEYGGELLPCIYDFITFPKPNQQMSIKPIVLQLKDKCSIANANDGKILLPFVYDEIKPTHCGFNLQDTIFLLKQANRFRLFSVNEAKYTEEYDNLIICERNNIVCNGNNYGIVDDYGKEIVPIKNHIITIVDKESKSFFEIKYNGLSALGDIKTGELLTDQIYDEISILCSGMNIFLVRIGNKFGCINDKGETWLPVLYDKIEAKFDFWAPWDKDYIVTLYNKESIEEYNLGEKRR